MTKIGMTLAWKTGVYLRKANKQIIKKIKIKKATNPFSHQPNTRGALDASEELLFHSIETAPYQPNLA